MAKEKAKPKSSKAKPKEEDLENSEIEDYSEINSEYSEENIEKTKESNIFGKAYKWLEEKYYSFSDWLSKKGINLNKVNDFLEEKGIPAFVFVTCLTIIILALLLFLIINFATKTTVEFNIIDYSNNPLSDVTIIISEVEGKQQTRFSDVVSDGDKKRLALKSGKTYQVNATKSDFANFEKGIIFERGTPLKIKFDESIEYGNLTLTVIDEETNKAIDKYTAKLNYTINGKSQEMSGSPTNLGQIKFTDLPIDKDLSLTIEADGYETSSQAIKITGLEETLDIKLKFDISSAQLEGVEARGVILTTTETGDLLDDCNVTVYNLAGEILANGITQLGKFTFTASPGSAIRFVAIKEGYRIYDSDDNNRTYRLQKSEETFTAKMTKGSSDLKVEVIEKLAGPLADAKVSLYNLSGNILFEETTVLDGQVIFTGLDKNTEYIVTACKEDYLCSQYFVNIDSSNNLIAELVKIGSAETYRLSIYVYDGKNNPISKANVLVYRKLNEKFVPIGLGALQVDLTGYTSIYAKSGDAYRVTGIVGDSNTSKEITIDPIKENKVILIINEASKELTLILKDIHGNDVKDGYVTVKSKLGEILYEGYIDEEPIKFSTNGYKDLIIDYMDENGDVTTVSATVGDSDTLTVTLRPTVMDQYPIISFLELRDIQNSAISILSKDKDYYVVFDIQLPLEAKNCGAHFRVGDDTETDSENMSYGITGFKADTTKFRYSTTYNYGQQSIDSDNLGEPNQLNKWLELYWSSSQTSNKQIMLKVKATEIGAMSLKYRAWCEFGDGLLYRDPKDTVLDTARNNSSRQSLYADTKEQIFNILETPPDCSNNLCIEYKFLDKDNFNYSKESFFGTLDEMYLLELSYYSTSSGNLTVDAETDKSHPIIGLINFQDTELFPDTNRDSQETKLSLTDLSIQSGIYKKQYLLFNAKNTGATYLDIKSTFNSLATEKRLSFEIKNKRNLEVLVSEILPYNSSINIEVKDADSKVAINNALVKITDEFGDLISSTKTARNGKYIINQNFSSTKPNLVVTAPGYAPFTKQLMIADTGIISGPDSIDVTFGDEISQESEIIKLVNKGNIKITDLTYNLTPIDEVAGLTTEMQLPIQLNPNSPEEIEVVSTIDPKIKFKSAKSVLSIFGFVGNKQVAKVIEINYFKGQVKDNCLDIKPLVIYSYVGISEGSENEIPVTLVNNCKKSITVTPELLKAKGTAIKKDENIEIVLPTVTLEPNQEITDYTITVKNNKARKSTKSYVFEIAWRNSYYALPYTKLNVDLVDYSKTLKVTPPVSIISMSQLVDEQIASNRVVFTLTNTGKYTLKDIQISRLDEKLPSNIQDKIEPMSFEEIKPGQSKQVYVIYEGKVDKARLATLFYKAIAISAGSKDPVETKFTVDFRFSSASCLKIDQKKISLYTKIGEEKSKVINITNSCAEPISYITYDINPIKDPNSFNLAFGEGTQVALVPAGAVSFIGVNQTVPFILKVKPTKYFTPRFENRVTLLGIPINNTPQSMVTSEVIWFSIEVEPENPDDAADLERVEENTEIKVCDDNSTIDVAMPKIVVDCKEEGYCDSESAAEYIAQKIQEMHNVVIDASKQVNDDIAQTTCPQSNSQLNGCPISEILKPEQLKEFQNIPIYLQNDSLTTRTLELILRNEKERNTKYPTIKEAMIRDNVGNTTGGLQTSGIIIHLENKMYGCGRYKISIDGSIATKNLEKLDPTRAYFFVTVDANATEACKKSIENVRMYLPKDIQFFTKSNTGNTWLTIISGDENIGKTVSKNVFNTEDRFQIRTEEKKKFSQLDITIGDIPENNDAIAKLYFNDPIVSKTAQAEKVNVIINDKFGITKDSEKTTYPEQFVKEVSENIKDILEGTPADVCISKDRNYMLIMSFTEDFGALVLKPQTEIIQLTPLEKCMKVTVKSAIAEEITITTESALGVKTQLDYQNQKYTGILSMVVEKDKDTDFNICFLGDIGDIGNWTDKKVKIIAESKYTTAGKINSKRKADANITLLNYGITPVDLLGITQTTAESLGKENANSSKSFYAYVYWNKEYRKEDIEKFCDTLEKYNKGLGDKATIYKKPDYCDFKESTSEKNARNTRALKRSGSYFTGCMLTCGTLTSGVNLIGSIFVIGVPKYIKDLVWNCGLGCGLPTITMYTKETGIADKIMDVIHKIPIVGDLAKLIEIIFGAVGNGLGAVVNAIMGGGSGVAEAETMSQQLANDGYGGNLGENAGGAETIVGIRDLTRPAGPGTVDPFNPRSTSSTINTPLKGIIDDLPGTIDITGGGGGGGGIGIINKELPELSISQVSKGGAIIKPSDEKIFRYMNYVANTDDAAFWFTAADPADQKVINKLISKVGFIPADERAIIRQAGSPKVGPEPRYQEVIDGFYNKLAPAEQKQFADIIRRNTDNFTSRGSSSWFKPNGERFANDIDNYLKTPNSITTVSTITIDQKAKFINKAKATSAELSEINQKLLKDIDDITKLGKPAIGSAEEATLNSLKAQQAKIDYQLRRINTLVDNVEKAPLVKGQKNLIDVGRISTTIDSTQIKSLNTELDQIDDMLKKISTGSGSGPRLMRFEDSKALQKSITSTSDSIKSQLDEITKIKTDKFGNVVPTDPTLKPEWDELIKNEKVLTNAKSSLDDVGKGLAPLTPDSAGNVVIDDALNSNITNISTIKGEIATANTALNGISTGTKVTTMTTSQVDDAIRNAGKSATSAAKTLTKVKAEIAALEKNKIAIPGLKKKRLDKLYARRDGLEEAGKKFTKVADDLTAAKSGASGQGAINISDDIARNMDDAAKSVKSLGLPTKFQNFLKGAGKFGLDILIVAASNWSGEEYLRRLDEEGQYNNLLYLIDGEEVSQFDKGTWYKVTIIKANKKYDLKIEKEIPAITDDVKIHYKEDKELKEILTSEHQAELLQNFTPQNSTDLNLYINTDRNRTQTAVNLEELQMNMYSDKESKLEEYDNCVFNGNSCLDIEALSPNYCAAFVARFAKENYDLSYQTGNACDPGTGGNSNFGTRNKVVWQKGVDPVSELENNLIPGAIIGIERPSNVLKGCQPTHVVVYVGKNNFGQNKIIHQWGAPVVLEGMTKEEGGKNFSINEIYQVVIPRSGYALYDNYAINDNLT